MGKQRLIDANALFDAPPEEMRIFVTGGRSMGQTAAMFEQLFKKRVDAAPTVNARPVVKVRTSVFVDWAERKYLVDPEQNILEELAHKLAHVLLEEGLVKITRNERLSLIGPTEFEGVVYVGCDELPEEVDIWPGGLIVR